MAAVLLVKRLSRLDVQQLLRHHIRAGRHHRAIADVEHGRGHDRRGAQERLHHRIAETADVEAGAVEHDERPVLHGFVPRRQKDEHQRNERDHEAEHGDPQHADIMRIRGERIDDGAGKRQIEQRDLHHAIVAVLEFSNPFEQIARQNYQQQRNRLNQCGHIGPSFIVLDDSLSMNHLRRIGRARNRCFILLPTFPTPYRKSASTMPCPCRKAP